MCYYIANAQDQKKAENIRSQYISRDDSKIRLLEKLDNKVKFPGKLISVMIGVTSALVMGAGMSLIIEWEDMQMGLALSIPGFFVALLACPVYALITSRRKKKYAGEIKRLSDVVMAN